MKINIIAVLALFFSLAACSNQTAEKGSKIIIDKNEKVDKPEELKDRMSYIMGVDAGRGFKPLDSNGINFKYFYVGMKDILDGKTPHLTEAERISTMDEFSKAVSKNQLAIFDQQSKRMDSLTKIFAKTTPEFLESYKKSSETKTTSSGLMYRVFKQGSGDFPNENSLLKMNFIAKLTNGEEFDNTYKKGKPVEMPLVALMPAWKEAMSMMKKGAHYEICIPPLLGFGEQGASPQIPGNSAIIFNIELLDIQEMPPGAMPPPPPPPGNY